MIVVLKKNLVLMLPSGVVVIFQNSIEKKIQLYEMLRLAYLKL